MLFLIDTWQRHWKGKGVERVRVGWGWVGGTDSLNVHVCNNCVQQADLQLLLFVNE